MNREYWRAEMPSPILAFTESQCTLGSRPLVHLGGWSRQKGGSRTYGNMRQCSPHFLPAWDSRRSGKEMGYACDALAMLQPISSMAVTPNGT